MTIQERQEFGIEHYRAPSRKHDKLILSFQREMGDENKKLDQTSAGKALNVELDAQKEQYEKRLKEQQDEANKALKENDVKYTQELLDAQDKISADMKRKWISHGWTTDVAQ